MDVVTNILSTVWFPEACTDLMVLVKLHPVLGPCGPVTLPLLCSLVVFRPMAVLSASYCCTQVLFAAPALKRPMVTTKTWDLTWSEAQYTTSGDSVHPSNAVPGDGGSRKLDHVLENLSRPKFKKGGGAQSPLVNHNQRHTTFSRVAQFLVNSKTTHSAQQCLEGIFSEVSGVQWVRTEKVHMSSYKDI